MKIYHVETQEAYDALMVELEEKGLKWRRGEKPTNFHLFKRYGKDTHIYDESGVISLSSVDYFKEHYSDEPIIEYKAKGEKMKIYHVETQQDYDALMIELEEKGHKWLSERKPTSKNYWKSYNKNICIVISGKYITFGPFEQSKKEYSGTPIIEYKAKGENMTEEEMKRYFLNESRDVSIAIENFVVDDSTTENSLSKAKSSAKKLIEKIDEYLESQKPKFKVGDYVTDTSNNDPFICKIEKFEGNGVCGKWYCVSYEDFSELKGLPISNSQLSTPEEIAEYEVALTFLKHDRRPFEVKRGDVVYLKGYDKNIFLDSGNIYKKHNFVDGDVALVKTIEEVNEWL